MIAANLGARLNGPKGIENVEPKAQIAELKQCCTLLLEKTSDKASILRVNELGPFNFEKIEGSIDVIRWISEQVEKISLESITENTINSMISNYKNLLHILNSITTFDPIQEMRSG